MEIEEKSKVYILTNEDGFITRIEGGYTMSNIEDIDEWTYIDEGYGDRFNLCQSCYLPKPLQTEDGRWQYRFVDNEIIEELSPLIPHAVEPTQLDRIEAQGLYTALMTGTLLEV